MFKVVLWVLVVVSVGLVGIVVVDDEMKLYVITEVNFMANGNRLEGKLILPEGAGPFPVVVFVHGDGPATADVDGTLQIYYGPVTRAGYAFLSWSKPGIGASEGDWLTQTMQDRAEEAADAARYLKGLPNIVSDQVGLMGASQAGWVMPKAVQLEEFNFMIAVATAVNWLRQGDYMTRTRLSAEGKSEIEITSALACNALDAEFYQFATSYQDYLIKQEALEPACYESQKSMVHAEDRWHFNRNNMMADATEDLRLIDIPVLALFGDKDAHVDVYESMSVYQREIPAAETDGLTVELFADANHALISSEVMEALSFKTWLMAILLADEALAEGVSDTLTRWLIKMDTKSPLEF